MNEVWAMAVGSPTPHAPVVNLLTYFTHLGTPAMGSKFFPLLM